MNFLPRRLYHDENGQSLYLVAGALVGLLGMAGLVIDLGYAYHAQRELQASADAAATAGALDLPYCPSSQTAINDALTASGLHGDENAVNDLTGVSMLNKTPLVECWQVCTGTQTTNCVPNVTSVPACSYYDATTGATVTTGNVMVVQETGTSPTFFSKVLGWKSFTINVTSVAMAKLANALPINIMMVVDSTASMGTSDSSCWSGLPDAPSNWPYGMPTREDCAKWGIRSMLVNLNSSVQNVGIATFPPVTNDPAEYDCSSPNLSVGNGIVGYNSPLSDSLITPLGGGYLNSNGTLDTSSDTVGTVYWTEPNGKTCSGDNYGLQDPGGEGTYYAQAIEAATSELNAATPKVTSAIIVLGDGTINYKSYLTGNSGDKAPCTSAINAAGTATADGIAVYSVGYGIPNPATSAGGDYAQSGGPSSNANCGPNDGTLTPCAVMQQIASTYGSSSGNTNFYADAESAAGCPSTANSALTDLGSIFAGLAQQFGNTRLLPSSLYVPPSS